METFSKQAQVLGPSRVTDFTAIPLNNFNLANLPLEKGTKEAEDILRKSINLLTYIDNKKSTHRYDEDKLICDLHEDRTCFTRIKRQLKNNIHKSIEIESPRKKIARKNYEAAFKVS